MARARSIGNIYAELSVRDKMTVGLKKAGKSLERFAATSLKIGSAAVAGGFALYIKKSISAASDLQETLSKSDVIFGQNAKEMDKWSDTAAASFGQSKQAALESAATIGNMFVAMGIGSGKVAEMSRSMIQLGSDLASFNNTAPEDAIAAIGAALRGESEPIRRYGVLLDDATLKAKAFTMGLYNGKGALNPQSRALAAYQVILDQTKTAQGDFAKTSDGLANSQRILAAIFEDTAAATGEGLLPVMQDFVNTLKDTDFKEFGKSIGEWSVDTIEAITKVGKAIDWYASKSVFFAPQRGVISTLAGMNPMEGTALPAPDVLLGGIGDATNPLADAAAGMANVMTGQFGPGGETVGTLPKMLERGFSDYARSVSEKAKVMADAMAEYNHELALANAQGNESKIKQLEDEWEIRNRILDLQKAGFSMDEATRMANDLSSAYNQNAPGQQPDWQSTSADVNSMQARGLAMGAQYVPKEVKDQVTLLEQLVGLMKTGIREGAIFVS